MLRESRTGLSGLVSGHLRHRSKRGLLSVSEVVELGLLEWSELLEIIGHFRWCWWRCAAGRLEMGGGAHWESVLLK